MQSIFVSRAQWNSAAGALVLSQYQLPCRNHADSRFEDRHSLDLGAKAVLKSPQSPAMRDWRDCRSASNFAKRLEYGAFTAAFRAATTAAMVQGFTARVETRALVFQFRRF